VTWFCKSNQFDRSFWNHLKDATLSNGPCFFTTVARMANCTVLHQLISELDAPWMEQSFTTLMGSTPIVARHGTSTMDSLTSLVGTRQSDMTFLLVSILPKSKFASKRTDGEVYQEFG
jgi:hypothetical protein